MRHCLHLRPSVSFSAPPPSDALPRRVAVVKAGQHVAGATSEGEVGGQTPAAGVARGAGARGEAGTAPVATAVSEANPVQARLPKYEMAARLLLMMLRLVLWKTRRRDARTERESLAAVKALRRQRGTAHAHCGGAGGGGRAARYALETQRSRRAPWLRKRQTELATKTRAQTRMFFPALRLAVAATAANVPAAI